MANGAYWPAGVWALRRHMNLLQLVNLAGFTLLCLWIWRVRHG